MYKIIGGDKKEYGPVSVEELRRWIAEGRVNAQTQVQAEGDPEWKSITVFPEFAEALAALSAATAQSAGLAAPMTAFGAEVLNRDYDLDVGACVSRAWGLLKNNFGLLFGGVAIYLLIEIGVSALAQIPILGSVLSLANFVITGPLIGGVYLFLLKNIRRQPAVVGDIFSGFQLAFGQLMLGYIVTTLLTLLSAAPGGVLVGISVFLMVSQHEASAGYITMAILGGIVALIPAIYLSVAWMFSLPLVIDKQLDFWPAMGISRRAVGRHWWTVFALVIVVGLINVGGFLACCVGVFVAFPLSLTAMMCAYEEIFSTSARPAT